MNSNTQWAGRLWFQPGLWAFSGEGGTAREHSHHAAQIAWAIDGNLHAVVSGRKSSGKWVIIPSGATHSFECSGRVLLVFLEPPLQGVDLALMPNVDSARKLIAQRPSSSSEIAQWLEQLLETLGIPKPPRALPSEPIQRAQAHVLSRLPSVPRLPEAARAANLAPTTLTHRFASEVGLPFRRWVLWMRVQVAARLVTGSGAGTASLTRAAHAAGFADSAHLSRTFRGLFGLPPSLVLPHLELIDLQDV